MSPAPREVEFMPEHDIDGSDHIKELDRISRVHRRLPARPSNQS